jgi:branched-chain amino acid aminotransferase
MLVYVNGRFLPREEARISVFDHGYLYGDGIYETLRAYRGTIFLLERHLDRFQRSAAAIFLTLPLTRDQIRTALQESLSVNEVQDAYIRIQISRGPGDIGLDPALCTAPTVVIMTRPFKAYPREHYDRGVSAAIVRTRRNHPLALDPAIKSTNFLNNILAKIESLRAGAYEGILLNWKGYVAEGTISNVFAVKNGVLSTPHTSTGILEGVTRGLVLDLARKLGIRSREVLLRPKDLDDAEECFITNTTIEVLPVTIIDGRPVGDGTPGAITRQLIQAYREEVLHHV